MNNIYVPKSEIIVPTGKVLTILRDVRTGRIVKDLTHNMFVTAGKNALADALRGTTANSRGIISYCAVGTGITAPALADTSLEAELFRKLISVRNISDSGNHIAEFTIFFTTSEANGTLKEAGLFGDAASETANSGTLFCRAAIDRVKTSNDTLTIVWSVIIG